MKAAISIERYLTRFPLAGAIFYVAVVIAFLLTTLWYVFDTLERRQAVAATSDLLSHLEGRKPSSSRNANANGISLVTGSPVLEGPTVTVAGATLLQRSDQAEKTFGGQIFFYQGD